MHNESLLERFAKMETRLQNLEAIVGTKKAVSPPLAPTIKTSGHRSAVLGILQDGIPKNVHKITSEAGMMIGKKQKLGSINAMCSELFRAGILDRPSQGVYQKKD